MVVVVAFELSWHCCGMSSINDQEAIEQLAADRPDEARRSHSPVVRTPAS
jgi:hypothetical protein